MGDAAAASDRCSAGLRERRADGYAEEHRQRWNGGGGPRVRSGRAVLDRLFEPLADRLADLAAARRPDQRLDGGCGTGSPTVAIAGRIGTTAQCVGVDISEPMLSAARASRHRGVNGNLHLRQRADLPVRAGKLRPDRVAFRRDGSSQDSVEALADLRRDGGGRRMIVGRRSGRTTRS